MKKMGIELLPEFIQTHYEVHEWKHACAILKHDFPKEWHDLIAVLEYFRLKRSDIVRPGGRKSPISNTIDQFLYERGWEEKQFNTAIIVDEARFDSPTHKIDCYRNNIAIEIEWNNKDPFFDRDLNNFRLLFELRVVSVGIIITRSDSLQEIFNKLGKGTSYGASTTHMGKLLPRIEGGSGGGCPILAFGITPKLYLED
ncbi:BglII/BstYI family type II restriction endonuclease [Hydrogenimonas sp.]